MKAEPDDLFDLLYDKIHREVILFSSYRVAKANGGPLGFDGVSFKMTDTAYAYRPKRSG